MCEKLNDKDLENVNGGIELEGFGKVPENDYDVVYKKDSDNSEPNKPIDAGKYKVDINPVGNYS